MLSQHILGQNLELSQGWDSCQPGSFPPVRRVVLGPSHLTQILFLSRLLIYTLHSHPYTSHLTPYTITTCSVLPHLIHLTPYSLHLTTLHPCSLHHLEAYIPRPSPIYHTLHLTTQSSSAVMTRYVDERREMLFIASDINTGELWPGPVSCREVLSRLN